LGQHAEDRLVDRHGITASGDHVGRLTRPFARRFGRTLQHRRGKPRGDFLSLEHVLGGPLEWLARPKVGAGSGPVNYS